MWARKECESEHCQYLGTGLLQVPQKLYYNQISFQYVQCTRNTFIRLYRDTNVTRHIAM